MANYSKFSNFSFLNFMLQVIKQLLLSIFVLKFNIMLPTDLNEFNMNSYMQVHIPMYIYVYVSYYFRIIFT